MPLVNYPNQSTTAYEFDFKGENDNVGYVLIYGDLPPNIVSSQTQAFLENFRNDFVSGKKLLSDQAISLNGVPGRAFTAQDKDGFIYEVHVYLAQNREYQLLIGTANGSSAAYRDAFMNSFKIQ